MGFLQNWKEKRQAKKAEEEFARSLSEWKRDMAIIEKLKKVFEAAKNGDSLVDESMVNAPGEIVLWKGRAQYHSAVRGAGHYEGGSQGASIRVMKGVSYRVGAQRGTFVQGAMEQRALDEGAALLTTKRVVFIGPLQTQEWKFSNWLGASASENEDDFMFMVSNRKTSSGLLMAPGTGREFNRFLALAIGYVESGVDKVLETIYHYEEETKKIEPKKG